MPFNCKLCNELVWTTYICEKCEVIKTYYALYGRDETLSTIEKVLKMRLEKKNMSEDIKLQKEKVLKHIKLKDRVV